MGLSPVGLRMGQVTGGDRRGMGSPGSGLGEGGQGSLCLIGQISKEVFFSHFTDENQASKRELICPQA